MATRKYTRLPSSRPVKHGHARRGRESREYRIWKNMLSRCCNSSIPQYANYGGRGICVCSRWQNSFSAFLNDMGPAPTAQLTLERIDNNGNYKPTNCRWATREEQNANMRTNRIITHNGKSLTLSQWAKLIGVEKSVLRHRLDNGWPVKKALSVKAEKYHQLTLDGETHNIAEWAIIIGVKPTLITGRLRRGWSAKRTLHTPVDQKYHPECSY